MNSYCSFCASAGFKGPHDHFLRASRDQGAKVVCPKLLKTECKFCHRLGHTVRFCAAKREQEMLAAAARTLQRKSEWQAGEWMDVGTHQKSEHPGFDSSRVTKTKVATPSAPKLASRFAALDLESESSSCDECEGLEPPPVRRQQPSSVWANVVKTGSAPRAAPVLDSWEDDEELPPLIFGRKLQTRWGDED
jgi:hypothetical protein